MDMNSTNIILSILGTGFLGILLYSLSSIKSDVKSVKDDVKSVKVEILSTVDKRFDQVESRIDNLESRFDQVESRIDNLESRIDNLESRFDKRFERFEQRFDQVDKRANEQTLTIHDVVASIKALGVRIDTLECTMQEKFDDLKGFQATTQTELANIQTELANIKVKIASTETTVTHTHETVMNQSYQLTLLSEYSERIANIEGMLNITPPHRKRTHHLEHAN